MAHDPSRAVDALNELRPDLIVMDLYLPDCTGIELAAVIRQQETHVGIPILFVSVEKDISKQLRAIQQGGDNFLTKPIAPEHLVSIVTSHAQRSRVLRRFMIRDALTGALNHTAMKEHLYGEFGRARRSGGRFAYAMIDLDRFKSINDTYGHPAGDIVIKSIARLLRQRLRKSDVIGRYGGDEFGLILLDTSEEPARHMLDEIRRAFSQLRHYSSGNYFTTTLSCGVASYPRHNDPVTLHEAADQALYRAKAEGGNRVKVSSQNL